jgi:ankyrin repeat protein
MVRFVRIALFGVAAVVAGQALAPASGAFTQASDPDRELIQAAGRGDAEAVRALLAAGASVHAADDAEATALVHAAYGNHLEAAGLLVAAGSDVNHQDRSRQSAFLIATSEGFHDMLLLCLEHGADVRRTDSYNGTGLIRAADRGHVEVIRTLLTTDIPIDHVNRLGWTALLEAIILGDGGARHTEVVRLLVEAGANVNLADGQGVTPLAHARRKGQTTVIAILEAAGAR